MLTVHGVCVEMTSVCCSDHDRVKVAQGVSGNIVDKGSVHRIVPYLTSSIQHGLQDIGVRSVNQLRKDAQNGKIFFEKRSPASQKEGDVHGLHSLVQFNGVRTFHLIHFQPLPFQPLTFSTYCIFQPSAIST